LSGRQANLILVTWPRSDLAGLPWAYQSGARRKNRTVPAYGLPPITASRHGAFDRTLIPPWSAFGIEIAIPAASKPKGLTMTDRKTTRPTHRVYAVRKIGQDRKYWAEIGAAWSSRDG
jgi:hypothetical protein